MASQKEIVAGGPDIVEFGASADQSNLKPNPKAGFLRSCRDRITGSILAKPGKSLLTQKQVLIELLWWSGVALILSVTSLPRLIGEFLTTGLGLGWNTTVFLGMLLIALFVVAAWSVRCWVELGRNAIFSDTDPLTGLHNRRHFQRLLEMEISRARRHSHPLSLIMFDIDDFKRINDSFGHAAGDELLRALSNLVNVTLRAQDNVTRWGGDEFVILAPETDLVGAFQLAERLRQRLSEHDFAEFGQVTGSFGVTKLDYADDLESLLGRVDRLLYFAKRGGRNVVQAEPTKPAGARQRNPERRRCQNRASANR